MPWYHRIATFLDYSLPQLRAVNDGLEMSRIYGSK